MKLCSLTALALVALVLGPTTVMADAFLGARTDFGTGSYPYSVAIGDVNADGKPDLVAANYGSNTVSVLLGIGNGTFGPKTDFPVGSSPKFVAIGDLNADGKPDLAVANFISATVSVLLGNGDGTFGAKTDFGTGSRPWSVAIGDLNADGKPDLAVANSLSNTVSVLLGNGAGSFGTRTNFATGTSPYSVAIEDLNADGTPDLAVASGIGVSVLLGNGSGTFGPRTDYATGSQPISVAIADLNGDSKPDLAVANYASNTVSVLPGNGNGTFGARTNYATGAGPFVVAIGNLSGDGSPDLAVANSSSNTVSVLLGGGSGAFGAKTDFGTGIGPFSVAIGDLNADGHPDLATANYGSFTLSVLLWQLIPTASSLASSPNPSIIGAAVTLTASVTPASATGSVTFRAGADSIGTATLSTGVATMTAPTLSLGNHYLTASYVGSSTFGASVSPVSVHTVVPVDSTTLALNSSPRPSLVAQTVLLTATVSHTDASGSVEFHDDGILIGTALLVAGHATLSVPGFSLGSHSLLAVYAGDPGHYGSMSPTLQQVVLPAPTTIAVVSSLNPSPFTQAVSFTASVTDSATGSAMVTGTVEFVIDSVVIGSPVVLAGGSATASGISSLAIGPHSVHAIYTGTASFLGSTSPAITQVVESPRPGLVAVRDIAADEGGHVELLWSASDLDLAPYNSIESYWVLRSAPAAVVARAALAGAQVSAFAAGSIDPKVGSFVAMPLQGTTYYWEYIASQPAAQTPTYRYVAPTTSDSVAGSNPLTAFMIMARTAGGAQWWFSDPDSGYSVDNLAPAAPTSFMGTYYFGVATLHWGRSPEPDLALYRLHRGATADFVPGPGNLVVTRADTGYVDAAGALYHYKLCAVDVHGNTSVYTELLPTLTTDVAGGATLAFALEGVRPNPSRGEQLSVSFTLPMPVSARLELVDVSGRRVVEREVGALGAGRHTVALGAGRRLVPGLYLLRLTQGASVRVTRAVVLK